MADHDPSLVEVVAGDAGAAAGFPPDPAQSAGGVLGDAHDDLAVRARRWFGEAYGHELWKEYIEQAEEDLQFYVGGLGQWTHGGSTDEATKLQEAGRSVVSVNICQSTVDLLTGLERQNRVEPRPAPIGDEDAQDVERWGQLLKFHGDQVELPDELSEMFEGGLIQGMKVMDVGLDWTNDPITGEAVLALLNPGRDWLCDPHFTKYDLSDARYMFKFQWSFVDDLVAKYPEHGDAIDQAARDLGLVLESGGGASTDGGRDAYGTVRGHPVENLDSERLFYDPLERKLLVMEVWYPVYRSVWLVLDKARGKAEEAASEAAARELAAADPTHLKVFERRVREIEMAVVLPALYLTLETGNPYENDRQNYPFVPFIAKRQRHHIYGVIRNIKDPQRIENRRWSQMLDILGRFANLRMYYFEKSLVNPNALQDVFSNTPLVVREGQQPPGFLVPPLAELVRVLTEVAIQMKALVRDITGVNTAFLGIKEGDQSGIAIARLQAQGQTGTTGFFDRFKRTRKLVAQRLARRIQQMTTVEQYYRITNDAGEPVVLRVNPIEARGKETSDYVALRRTLEGPEKPWILRDPSMLKYDMVMADGPTTPTARAASALALLDVVGKVPALWPALVDIILELLDIPRRAEVLQRVKTLVASQMAGPGGGGAGLPTAMAVFLPVVVQPILKAMGLPDDQQAQVLEQVKQALAAQVAAMTPPTPAAPGGGATATQPPGATRPGVDPATAALLTAHGAGGVGGGATPMP